MTGQQMMVRRYVACRNKRCEVYRQHVPLPRHFLALGTCSRCGWLRALAALRTWFA